VAAPPPLESGETGLSTPPPFAVDLFFVPKKSGGGGVWEKSEAEGSGPEDVDAGGQEGVGGHRHEFVHETEEPRPGACLGTGRGAKNQPPPPGRGVGAVLAESLRSGGRGRGSPPTPPPNCPTATETCGAVWVARQCVDVGRTRTRTPGEGEAFPNDYPGGGDFFRRSTFNFSFDTSLGMKARKIVGT